MVGIPNPHTVIEIVSSAMTSLHTPFKSKRTEERNKRESMGAAPFRGAHLLSFLLFNGVNRCKVIEKAGYGLRLPCVYNGVKWCKNSLTKDN